MTQCRTHPDVPSIAECEDCKAPLCPACTEPALGRTYCASCLAARVGVGTTASRPRLKIPWLAFVASALPGLGQVYNGLVARGLAQFGAWWLVLMLEERGLPGFLLDFAAVVALVWFWIWCALDAKRSAREINARGFLPTREEARSITRGPVGEREVQLAGVGLVVVGVMLTLQEIGGFLLQALRFAFPLLLVGAGWWILSRAKRRQAADGARTVDAGGVGA